MKSSKWFSVSLFLSLFLFGAGCATAIPPEPTDESPAVGCVKENVSDRGDRRGDRFNSEMQVIVYGDYDENNFKVFFPDSKLSDKFGWLPFPKDKVTFGLCRGSLLSLPKILVGPSLEVPKTGRE